MKRKTRNIFMISGLIGILIGGFLFFSYMAFNTPINTDSDTKTKSEEIVERVLRKAEEFSNNDNEWSLIDVSDDSFEKEDLNGYYRGTLDFMDDIIGEQPINFTIEELRSTEESVNITQSIDGHTNVIEMKDSNAGIFFINYYLKYQYQESQSEGIVELWIRTSQSNALAIISFGAFEIRIREGDLSFFNLSVEYDLMEINSNEWYRMRISFDCNSNKVNLIFNETNLGDHNIIDVVSIEYIKFGIQKNIATFYIDAIGFDWLDYDLDYNKHPIIDQPKANITNDRLELITNIYEEIKVKSNDEMNFSFEGAYEIEVKYQTNSFIPIYLDLIFNDIILKSYTINDDITEEMEILMIELSDILIIDQLQIRGYFQELSYMDIDYIRIYKIDS